MNESVLNQMINLKGKRRVLEAKCGENINVHTFTRIERQQINQNNDKEELKMTLDVLNNIIDFFD